MLLEMVKHLLSSLHTPISCTARSLKPFSSHLDLPPHDHMNGWPLVEFEDKTTTIGPYEISAPEDYNH
jgi:hypothetical protein